MADLAEVTPPDRLWRVARSNDPLRMSQISQADHELERAGNRFDTVDGRVLYASTAPTTCYLETLARFRPTAAVRAAVQDEDLS